MSKYCLIGDNFMCEEVPSSLLGHIHEIGEDGTFIHIHVFVVNMAETWTLSDEESYRVSFISGDE